MFRELYKQANDEIKGDRQILDKAFEMAQKPEKKPLPIFKYSFVGTAVAAVIVLGAIFANTEVFMQRTVEPPARDNAELTTEISDGKVGNEVVTEIETSVAEKETVKVEEKKTYPEKEIEPPEKKEVPFEQVVPTEAVMVINEDYDDDIMVLGLDEDVTDTGIGTWGLRRGEEAATEATFEEESYMEDYDEDVIAGETFAKAGGGGSVAPTETQAEAVNIFSYMQDVSLWDEHSVIKEGFVNTTVSPVTNKTEAIERADNEDDRAYHSTAVYYDPVEGIWRVEFNLSGPDGGNVIVYLNGDGITQMIVYPGYYFGE